MLPFALIAGIAGVVTAAASFGVLRLSRRLDLAPEVRERDVHTSPTPRLGGVAMYVGLLAAVVAAAVFTPLGEQIGDLGRMWGLLGACSLIALVGILDDLLDLDWMLKLAAQLAAAGLLAWQGVQIISVPFGNTQIVGSPAATFVLTVFLMTLVMNAVNFVDGLDGLVAGVAIIANSVFFVYTQLLTAETGGDSSISFAAVIAAIVVGMAAGFLPFNWHRAKMFMGDTGALLIGLLMAVSTVSVTGQLNPGALDQKLVLASYIPIILPIAVLALPLADFTLAVLRRVQAGKSPFSADRQHLHHRLLDMGHSPVQAVLIFYLWTAVISVACLLVFTMQSFFWPAIVAISGGVLCLVVTLTPLPRVRARMSQRGLLRWSLNRDTADDERIAT
ncbi:MAG: undecaprenyl/decaprenyl-phosphate alpha-N-acetylglucosaminyl 1-phosphate transferase [Leucobacter sp.]|nr:undecaprenyl/decaprenyl-phosphate alpha-N-acetylglucosaminyl 1-phosphate transferase [Leucobacter sp.]